MQRTLSSFSEAWQAFGAYPKAWRFIKQHRLWPYLYGPGLFNLALFLLTGWLGWQLAGDVAHALIDWWGLADTEVTSATSLLEKVAYWATWLTSRLLAVVIWLKLYKYLMLILIAPLLSLVAERTQELLRNEKAPPFQLTRLWKDFLRGTYIALRSLLIELTLLALLMLAGLLLPIIGPVLPPVLLLIESYFYGFSMMDYHFEYWQVDAKQSIATIQQHRPLAVGNGLAFALLLLIPLLGVVVAPVLGVVSAGLTLHQRAIGPHPQS